MDENLFIVTYYSSGRCWEDHAVAIVYAKDKEEAFEKAKSTGEFYENCDIKDVDIEDAVADKDGIVFSDSYHWEY